MKHISMFHPANKIFATVGGNYHPTFIKTFIFFESAVVICGMVAYVGQYGGEVINCALPPEIGRLVNLAYL